MTSWGLPKKNTKKSNLHYQHSAAFAWIVIEAKSQMDDTAERNWKNQHAVRRNNRVSEWSVIAHTA